MANYEALTAISRLASRAEREIAEIGLVPTDRYIAEHRSRLSADARRARDYVQAECDHGMALAGVSFNCPICDKVLGYADRG